MIEGDGELVPFFPDMLEWHRSDLEMRVALGAALEFWRSTHGELDIDVVWLQGWTDSLQWWADERER